MSKIKIAPSILSADFSKLAEEIKTIENHSDYIHVDVMDGHFVDNITFGPVVVESIKTKVPLDCHLMIEKPVKYAEIFAEYCKRISFHAELFENNSMELKEAIKKIKSFKVEVGVAINPDKSLDILLPVIDEVDYILIMSVYAGFGGQKFMPEVLKKIEQLRTLYKFKKDISIDGGINQDTAKMAIKAGANVLVAGSSIFSRNDRKEAIEELRG